MTAPSSPDDPSRTPSLSPAFCYTPLALRTFLRQSRAIVDDPISQQLSAFSQPASKPFHPLTSLPPARIPSSSRLSESTCSKFVSRILLPAWNDRSRVIQYCSNVAEQDDDNDPERAIREAEQKKKQEIIVDERLDPYSGRFEVRESRQQKLRRFIREEWEIESIIRGRSWGVIRGRCDAVSGDWSDVAPVPEIEHESSAGRRY